MEIQNRVKYNFILTITEGLIFQALPFIRILKYMFELGKR
jgi:hypothetical protein